jgi:HAD superfamily hydrolase (TIGR01509 family)
MDGVLVDSEPLHTASYVQAFKEVNKVVTAEQYRQAVTLGNATVKKFYLSVGGDIEQWDTVAKRKAVLVRELMHARGRLMPGIIELLEALKAERIPTALATSSGKKSLEAVMSKFDLRPYFQHVATWEDVNAVKPKPDGFIFAAEKLGVQCCDCVVFEDTPRGVLAANLAGMKCVAIPTSTTHDGDFSLATLVVKSLEDVDMGVIRGLFG